MKNSESAPAKKDSVPGGSGPAPSLQHWFLATKKIREIKAQYTFLNTFFVPRFPYSGPGFFTLCTLFGRMPGSEPDRVAASYTHPTIYYILVLFQTVGWPLSTSGHVSQRKQLASCGQSQSSWSAWPKLGFVGSFRDDFKCRLLKELNGAQYVVQVLF